MELAIEQAKLAQKDDEVPIGAVIVSGSNVVSSAHNISNDPTAHAEMLAIRQAFSTSTLCDAEMYVTLEPCPMCAQAISFARIKRLYFGLIIQKVEELKMVLRYFNFAAIYLKFMVGY
ncbi:tRNA-specific adenosine deaminase [Trichonephila clavata]|uniref:tRNA-specific adenosine deaminase n=1 Tax=Trichonephila clavata TaxID=2740835 RepID=A0A8X6LTF3_TRICU|nr:tRNA-specific adenosine deaminase [Trichonephila clavata]